MTTITPAGPLPTSATCTSCTAPSAASSACCRTWSGRWPRGDTARATTVADHLDLILAGLHMHHTGEDEVLWPLLLERAAPAADLVHTMQAQHEAVDGHADRIGPLLAEWRATASPVRGEQLARLVEAFREALLEHLDLEEREILPLASRHVTAEEWDSLGDHGVDAMTKAQLPLMFGAVLEDATRRGAGDDARQAAAADPAAAHAPLGKWQYRRYLSRVRAG